jgi:fused signal recognition particle receptor
MLIQRVRISLVSFFASYLIPQCNLAKQITAGGNVQPWILARCRARVVFTGKVTWQGPTRGVSRSHRISSILHLRSPPSRDGIIAGVPASHWKQALSRTRRVALARLGELLGTSEVDASFWETVEECLVQADVGADVAFSIVGDLQSRASSEGWTTGPEALEGLRHKMIEHVDLAPKAREPGSAPEIVLVIGVNGSGKTTSVAKLAHRMDSEGKRVLLAAADTFRAAGAEQLERWAEMLNMPVVRGDDGGDPAAVAYQAIQRAQQQGMDAVVIDTSGRMHTSHNLMAELAKIARAIDKAMPGAPHQTLIVLDATTGQNAIAQAEGFTKAVAATGILLAKLDSSAKGGVGLAIVQSLGLPICYVGLGEGPDDLVPFDSEAYVDGLLADLLRPSTDGDKAARSSTRHGGER